MLYKYVLCGVPHISGRMRLLIPLQLPDCLRTLNNQLKSDVTIIPEQQRQSIIYLQPSSPPNPVCMTSSRSHIEQVSSEWADDRQKQHNHAGEQMSKS